MEVAGVSAAFVAVLGGCRVDPPDAGGYAGASGSGSSGEGSIESSGNVGSDVGSGAEGSSASASSSSDDGSTLTMGVDATGTDGTSGGAESSGTTASTATTGDESSSGAVSWCGDGELAPGEVCDDGVNDGGYGGCMPDCASLGPYCGDGAVDGPEACDDGINDGAYGGCVPGCLALAEHCGDGVVSGLELCDDGINDGAYGGCMPGCLVLAEHCGDAVVSGPELCDDGPANGSYGGCAVGCLALAEHCGDGAINGPEVCDDGLNDGAYGNCGLDCLSPATYCGDGIVNGPEACDDGNADVHDGCLASCTVPTSCVDIVAYDPAAPDGAYVIDPDGSGAGLSPFEVYCNMTIDGGGWQLVSVRHQNIGVLFADAVCTGLETDCSGTIPDVELVPGAAPDLLFATTDGVYWLRLTGLNPPGSDSLLDVITLDRVLEDTDSCTGNHYCGANLDTGLMVAGSSPNFVPRHINLPSQYARAGGIWLGNGGGSGSHHVVSLNYYSYCNPNGLQLSDASSLSLGNVTCTQPGALYFRY